MVEPLTTFAARRWRNIAITFVLSVVVVAAHAVYAATLFDTAFFSGWLLLVAMLLLTLFTVRKKVPVLPIGSSAAWLQFHIYTGWLSIVLFVLHIGLRVPDGWLEATIAVLFVLVAGSGAVGLALSRGLSRRLTQRGEEVIFERIPVFRVRLRDEVEALVLRSAREAESSSIADFYAARLKPFFDAPRNFAQHLRQSNRALFNLLAAIDDIERYLSPKEREFSDELRRLVQKKDELDYHYALQATLKGWLLVHVPLTYGLLILVFLHMVVVYAFTGGVS